MKSLERLVSLLEKDGIKVDSIELAESLWLSKYISKTEPVKPSNSSDKPTIEPTEQQPTPTEEPPKPPQNSKVKQLQKQKRKDAPLHPISDSENKSSLPFRTPLIRRLYKDNDLIFAFRHFRQKIVSLKKGKLDEEKIADYMAKTDIFRPFYQKSYEKRFRIIFIVDGSDSMKIWESLIDEFVKDVKNYHIFKEVKLYYLSSDHPKPKLYRKKPLTSALNEKWYRAVDQNSITFMFSDMLSKAWSSGELLHQISHWQNHFPFAIVQMLPQRLWNGTKLIDASMGKMSSQKRFVLNRQLVSRAEEILAIEEEVLPKLIKLPLLNFSEDSIDEYGKVMRSLPNSQIEGALFETEDFRGEYQPTQTENSLNAEQRLRGFYKYASTQAKTLLELLAVVPLSLPIIKLVQQKLLPQSTQEHLSEIFISSIIDKEQKVDGFYQFSKLENEKSGVREELIKKIGARKAFETINKLSEVIKRHGGVFDFLAFVVDPDSLKSTDEFSEIDREFARISVSVLHEMGGKYCDLIKKLDEKIYIYNPINLDDIPISTDFCMLDYECDYIKGNNVRMNYKHIEESTTSYNTALVNHGWRRFGSYYFHPICKDCNECKSIRVNVQNYILRKSQKRVIKKNNETEIIVQKPSLTKAHIELYNKFHKFKQKKDNWSYKDISIREYKENFVEGAHDFGKEVLYMKNDKLIGVDLIDILDDGISSIYFYYDPEYSQLSLGTYSLLYQIELAKVLELSWIYIGYWVKECKSFAYKLDFQPQEILDNFPDISVISDWKKNKNIISTPPTPEV